jgi:hypothetical protein
MLPRFASKWSICGLKANSLCGVREQRHSTSDQTSCDERLKQVLLDRAASGMAFHANLDDTICFYYANGYGGKKLCNARAPTVGTGLLDVHDPSIIQISHFNNAENF